MKKNQLQNYHATVPLSWVGGRENPPNQLGCKHREIKYSYSLKSCSCKEPITINISYLKILPVLTYFLFTLSIRYISVKLGWRGKKFSKPTK